MDRTIQTLEKNKRPTSVFCTFRKNRSNRREETQSYFQFVSILVLILYKLWFLCRCYCVIHPKKYCDGTWDINRWDRAMRSGSRPDRLASLGRWLYLRYYLSPLRPISLPVNSCKESYHLLLIKSNVILCNPLIKRSRFAAVNFC